MPPTDRVTVFLRHCADLLLVRDEAGWDGVTRPLRGDPEATLRSMLDELVPSCSDAQVVRDGTAVPVRSGRTVWRRHPFLVDVDRRRVRPPETASGAVWASPTTLRRHRAGPGAWRAYRRCGATLATVNGDDEHGSTYVSLRALEALRDLAVDAAALATDPDDRRSILREHARQLATCRPELVAVGVRIDRVMGEGDGPAAPADVVDRCEHVIRAAVAADSEAAANAARRVRDATVLTLSRSGTVEAALQDGDPERIWVLESRPGREGVATAEALADGSTPVTLAVDAAISHLLEREAIDVVLVGADAVGPDGEVRNKVGTHTLARAGAAADVPVVAVASVDKVSPSPLGTDPAGPTTAVYDGDGPVDVSYPLFDRTPPEAIAALIAESGELAPDDVRDVADRHRNRRRWRDRPAG